MNAILGLKEDNRICSITYKNPFNLQELPIDKLSVMDIKVETERHELIDIEVQIGYDPYFKKRSLFYWSSLYNNSIKSNESYVRLKKCIVINIVDFTLFNGGGYHKEFQVLEATSHLRLVDDLEIHFIELPLVDDKKPLEDMTDIEKWMIFMKDSDIESKRALIEALKERKVEIKMAADHLDKINGDELLKEQLEAIEKYRYDVNTRMHIARMEGLEEGHEKGLEEGVEQGSNNKALQIARSLLGKLKDDEIAEVTGLSLETVKKLRE